MRTKEQNMADNPLFRVVAVDVNYSKIMYMMRSCDIRPELQYYNQAGEGYWLQEEAERICLNLHSSNIKTEHGELIYL